MIRAWLAVLLLTVTVVHPVLAQGTVEQISAGLMCQCGCTMVLSTCTCSTADQMRALIREKLEAGQTPQEISQYFVGQYGEKVLAAPTKRGFNLTAYVLPFVAMAAGGGLIYLLLRQWVFRGQLEEVTVEEAQEIAPQYVEQLRQELESYGE